MSVIPLVPNHDEETGPAVIGSRWHRGHVIRLDTERGTYEELSQPIREEALHVQRALIDKLPAKRVPWQVWWLLLLALAVAAVLVLKT